MFQVFGEMFLAMKNITIAGAGVVAGIPICILAVSVDIGFQIEHIHVHNAVILRAMCGEYRNNRWMRQMA